MILLMKVGLDVFSASFICPQNGSNGIPICCHGTWACKDWLSPFFFSAPIRQETCSETNAGLFLLLWFSLPDEYGKFELFSPSNYWSLAVLLHLGWLHIVMEVPLKSKLAQCILCKYVHFIFNGCFIKQAKRLEDNVKHQRCGNLSALDSIYFPFPAFVNPSCLDKNWVRLKFWNDCFIVKKKKLDSIYFWKF